MAFDFDPTECPTPCSASVCPPSVKGLRKRVQGMWMGEFRFLKERIRISRSAGFQTKLYVNN
jgi:hypothetical protein